MGMYISLIVELVVVSYYFFFVFFLFSRGVQDR